MSVKRKIRIARNPFTGKITGIKKIKKPSYKAQVQRSVGLFIFVFNDLEQMVNACLIEELKEGRNDEKVAARLIGNLRFTNKIKLLFDLLEHKYTGVVTKCKNFRKEFMKIDDLRHKIVHGSYIIDDDIKSTTITNTKPKTSTKISDISYEQQSLSLSHILETIKNTDEVTERLFIFYSELNEQSNT